MPRQFGAGERIVFARDLAERTGYRLPPSCTSTAYGNCRASLARGKSFIGTPDRMAHVPAFPVTAVDTTAAGDAFNGALAVALSEGRPLELAVRFANAAAGLACTQRGARISLPVRAQVDAVLAVQPS